MQLLRGEKRKTAEGRTQGCSQCDKERIKSFKSLKSKWLKARRADCAGCSDKARGDQESLPSASSPQRKHSSQHMRVWNPVTTILRKAT